MKTKTKPTKRQSPQKSPQKFFHGDVVCLKGEKDKKGKDCRAYVIESSLDYHMLEGGRGENASIRMFYRIYVPGEGIDWAYEDRLEFLGRISPEALHQLRYNDCKK